MVIGGYTHITFSQESVKSVNAVKSAPPRIDGSFSDSEWLQGGKATGFIQMEPKEGESSTEKTEVYFLYDDANLYIGIQCFTTEPGSVCNQLGYRDNPGFSDYISIYIDSFHDHLNAYQFGVSAAGTMSDGRWHSDNSYDRSWDGVWWVETAITSFGWVAEFRIPFNTFQFTEKDSSDWGLNIFRIIKDKNEFSYWQNVKRDDNLRVSKFGHLKGLTNIKQGVNLEILPYLTSRIQKDRASSLNFQNENGIAGLDVKYGITSNLTATLTVNPDFAQIEADEDLINLTRYPLYLDEKRPFFTEGASIFSTAGSNNNGTTMYSRRINEPVYGLKMNGKIGGWDFGLMNSLNENDVGINNRIDDEELPENSTAKALYSILRVSRDIFSKSQIGLITMSKEYSGGFNRFLGIDGRLRLKNNFEVYFEGIKSFSESGLKRSHSLYLETRRVTDLLSYNISYREQTPEYDGNEIGFYNYNDFRNASFWIRVAPRFEKIGIRQFEHNINFRSENFWANRFLNKEQLTMFWNYNTNLTLMNYWNISGLIQGGEEYDRVEEVLYPVDLYKVGLRNNQASKIVFNVSYSQGKYRTGDSWSSNNSVEIKANDRLNISTLR